MERVFVDVWHVASQPLNVLEGLSFVQQPSNGAESLFIGTVREFNQGKSVLGVSYDVFEPLARKSFADICEEAQAKWGKALSLYVVHGKGRLDVGGISIVIAVGSPHRDEAFKACRYLIEQIKHRSPVWKLEHYEDGDSEWTQGCELCTDKDQVEEHHHHG